MKKIYSTGFMLLIIFSACSKDFLKSYDRRIVGTWRISDVDRRGLGGNTDNLVFREGSNFTFNDDGTLTYKDASGNTYQGSWNITKKYAGNETTLRSLEITAVDFTNQRVVSEYYDDMNFVGTNHFKTWIESGMHTYITHFRR